MSQPQAHAWIYILTPLLRYALAWGAYLPTREGARLADVLAATEELMALLDGVERPRQRPTDPDQQRANYSVKKKRHMRKNILVSTYHRRRGEFLSPTVEGRRHENAITDQSALTCPDDLVLAQDPGLQGYGPANVRLCQPTKKPKGRDLSAQENARNPRIARLRVRIEHVIAGVKRSRIVKDLFRNTKHDYDDQVMEMACGLHNFHAECCHWDILTH